jgi:hypothetical protein
MANVYLDPFVFACPELPEDEADQALQNLTAISTAYSPGGIFLNSTGPASIYLIRHMKYSGGQTTILSGMI